MQKLPLFGEGRPQYESMWDGYWIREFVGGKLVISCSFDRIYYRNYDLIFEGVTFFNVPDEWRDTNVFAESPIAMASEAEFSFEFEDIDTTGKKIFLVELYFSDYPAPTHTQHSFYIVATDGYALKCDGDADCFYTDPIEKYLSKENRVPLLK